MRRTGADDFTPTSAATLHFVELAVWDDRIELTAVGLEGAFDHAQLTPAEPVLAGTHAGWDLGEQPSFGARLAGLGMLVWLVTAAPTGLGMVTASTVT